MSYLGSKAASGVYQKIIAEMPPHDTYIETHLGSGAVMFYKPLAARTIGIDVDESAFKLTRNRWSEMGETPPLLHLYHGDAVGFLEREDFTRHGRVLVYSDPPYLPETRTSRARYRHEYTVADHERLLACLMSLPENVSVILSGYPLQLYDETLVGWRSKEFQAMTRGGVRTEKIWMNYQEGRAYSHTFAGKNYNDRYRIKRKAQRWKEKFAALPPAERLAIMAALGEVDQV
ncbi:TPA: DNA adenine methylase [Citrobacter freundii]|uniref:DNA adenine methylase n=1 Tax=Enterobacter asburiae TaxID=61645 RepID=UPI00287B4EC2|nr:DNA adenine methylase [Enterobacter asburiae]HBZ9067858.1 DNA adenine methylase [Citrobacter freundii]MDS1915420.1 DNA adenine methylase [Enterobacter asburiae]HBZ9266440.1 DNA adenine methylase [Citrobacter freundii]HBZ9383480.1 DNA adenine methylase [Citrobacter freundii]HBZ9646943.1 DNA adenine methylase [Citrobacter freundii]